VLYNPGAWMCVKPVTVNGNRYEVGDLVGVDDMMAERKIDHLVSRRYLEPEWDPHLRKTDHGQRCHPTPTRVSGLLWDLDKLAPGPRVYRTHGGV
jgi:hypothetical protein